MKQFNEMGIAPTIKSFTGEKIKIEKLLNLDISVHAYRIEPSKFIDKGNGKRLCLQITHKGELRIVFTGSLFLMDMIQRVAENDFPFSTIIKEINDHYEFS